MPRYEVCIRHTSEVEAESAKAARETVLENLHDDEIEVELIEDDDEEG